MRFLFCCSTILLLLPAGSFAQEDARNPPAGVQGVVRRHEQFSSRHVAARNIDVWLPPGYHEQQDKRYPVIYMHDGQNLFDPRTSYIGVDWGVDEAMTRLIQERQARAAIVVGIWNTPARVAEYMPQKPLEEKGAEALQWLAAVPGGAPDSAPLADNYLKFLVFEVKPFIDATYRTLRGRKHTFIMGSSMGGLISLYAISEYPQVFGGAGAVSTHWPAADGIVIDWFRRHLPNSRTHKIYMDYGTETLDAAYEPYQQRMDQVMKAAGYRKGKNWLTRKFPGAEHSERAWSKRIAVPLVFLLGK